MIIEQSKWTPASGWQPTVLGGSAGAAQLVFLFGSKQALANPSCIKVIKKAYPEAHLFGCSTAGEICNTEVLDDSLVATAVHFEHTQVKATHVNISETDSCFDAGSRLAARFDVEQLCHVFVLSDGLQVNGSDLVNGMCSQLPSEVSVTGGLSGDGDRFGETLVLANETPKSGVISAVGLYGTRLDVGCASLGGWDPFGPHRVITRAEGNVLYELDGKSALALYKEYLGDHAKDLPATGLLFPLSVCSDEQSMPVVRTILSVDEATQSLTFAGDVPEGALAQLMTAHFDRLVEGAIGAAEIASEALGSTSPDLALLISCVGRRLVLGPRIEEETEGVREVMGDKTVLTGFYSYGEISPFTPNAKCELHNQTMTITALTEV